MGWLDKLPYDHIIVISLRVLYPSVEIRDETRLKTGFEFRAKSALKIGYCEIPYGSVIPIHIPEFLIVLIIHNILRVQVVLLNDMMESKFFPRTGCSLRVKLYTSLYASIRTRFTPMLSETSSLLFWSFLTICLAE